MFLTAFYFFKNRAQDRDQCLILVFSQFKESLVNLRDGKMRTLLHIAAYQNAFACFKVLLSHDASVNLKDIHNRTPLMLASYMGHMRIVGKYFMKNLVNFRLDTTTVVFAEALLEKKCDLDVADSSGNTALHIACQRGHEAIASLILKATTTSKSTCISHQNKNGQT